MRRVLILFLVLALTGGLLSQLVQWSSIVRAEEQDPEEEYIRKTIINVEYTAHEWWLVRWANNDIACRFLSDHEGWPTNDEVETWCGKDLYKEWLATDPCEVAEEGGDVSQCPGLYMNYFQAFPKEKELEVELPLPDVWLAISGCELNPPENTCNSLPNLMFIAEEPLANEAIIRIQGFIDGEPFSCPGEVCTIPLKPTGTNGVQVEFWADSSFGDSSEHFTGLVRVQPWGDFMSPEAAFDSQPLYYVDVLSSQWRGAQTASCTETWQVFPEVGGPPPWLLTPQYPEELYTTVSFYYLAGMLINEGQVDAGLCPDEGLQDDLVANACGVQTAYDQVVEWQNLFDEEIFKAAIETGVPAQLLKNVFSRESQFWPGFYQTYREAGFGQLTENGADTVLLWNPSFFSQFCPLVLGQDRCDLGFGNISEDEQAMLRGALVRKVNSSCPECPIGIDLSQANFSVHIFAEGMLANCEQVGRILTNVTNKTPGEVSNFEDLWRFTLVNYNAGPGCLIDAVRTAYSRDRKLNWETVSSRLTEGCQGAISYVEDISMTLSGVTPTPTSWVQFGTPSSEQLTAIATENTPEPLFTNTPNSVQPTPTPSGFIPGGTAVPTQSGYPAPQPTVTTQPYP
ncbi:MAG: hypothetical protein CL609_03740 [Anaerolineaceae bacterium]|nr:hypothetical protein [Anaerolineaceae bacterium]